MGPWPELTLDCDKAFPRVRQPPAGHWQHVLVAAGRDLGRTRRPPAEGVSRWCGGLGCRFFFFKPSSVAPGAVHVKDGRCRSSVPNLPEGVLVLPDPPREEVAWLRKQAFGPNDAGGS